MKAYCKNSLVVLLMVSSSHCCASELCHPGGLHTQQEIQVIHQCIADQREPWISAYRALIEQADTLLTKESEAVADFNVPGYYIDAQGHREAMARLSQDAWIAYACALAYQLTLGDSGRAYALQASEILLTWAEVNKRTSGYDGRLAMADAGVGLVLAAELMTDYQPWTGEQRESIASWIREVYLTACIAISDRPNNWGDWANFGCVAAHHYLDDTAGLKADIVRIKRAIDLNIAPDGHMPHETKRGKRGLWYTYFSLAPMTAACRIVQNAMDVDLFHFKGMDGAGIEDALDYLLRFEQNSKKWPHYQGDDLRRGKPDRYPGNLYEAMYGIYGKSEYEAWVREARPIMVYGHHYAWAVPTLMHSKVESCR